MGFMAAVREVAVYRAQEENRLHLKFKICSSLNNPSSARTNRHGYGWRVKTTDAPSPYSKLPYYAEVNKHLLLWE